MRRLWLVVVWRRAHANWSSMVPKREGAFVPFRFDDAFGGLTFYDPLFVAPLPDDSHRLLVVERRGTIQLLEGGPKQFATRVCRNPNKYPGAWDATKFFGRLHVNRR